MVVTVIMSLRIYKDKHYSPAHKCNRHYYKYQGVTKFGAFELYV